MTTSAHAPRVLVVVASRHGATVEIGAGLPRSIAGSGAQDHRTFPGRLDEQRLSFGERAMVTAMRAPVGDSRDWDAVRGWGEEIAGQIAGVGAPAPAGP